MIFKDQLQRSIQIQETPKRIVSLVPSQTELLVDLGLEHAIVGVTKFCVHPDYLRTTKRVVGGTKNVNYNTVEELKPDIILCNKEENTEEMIQELENIAPVHISDIYTIEDCLNLIEMYGSLFSVKSTAMQLVNKISMVREDFQDTMIEKSTKKAAYFIWKNPWMVAGSNTFINHLLELNGFENVYAFKSRYPETTIKELNEKGVEVVLLPSEPYPFKLTHIENLQKEVPNTKIIIVDGEYFSWYGSRLTQAFDYFTKLRQEHFQ